MSSPLPPQKVVLSVTHKKVQLIDLFCKYVQHKEEQLPDHFRKLVITGTNQAPVEFHMGRIIEKVDLKITHKEADVTFVQQVVYLAFAGFDTIQSCICFTYSFIIHHKTSHVNC